MSLSNKGVNIGHSSRLGYDKCYYNDRLSQSVGPLLYTLNPNSVSNCKSCLSVFGPRTSMGGRSFGVSSVTPYSTQTSQDLADLESILTNRNVIQSKCKDGKVNDIDVTKFRLQHARVCNDFLDPVATHLTNPPTTYRGLSINRFYDLPKQPQANIFWDFAVNTQLEAVDNYREKVPHIIKYDPALPKELKGKNKSCRYKCTSNCPDSGNCVFE